MTRTALLVRYAGEADRIRVEAQRERRTISNYVSNIAAKAAADDRVFSKLNHEPINKVLARRLPILPGRRTAILVRCAAVEAERIRLAQGVVRCVSIHSFSRP